MCASERTEPAVHVDIVHNQDPARPERGPRPPQFKKDVVCAVPAVVYEKINSVEPRKQPPQAPPTTRLRAAVAVTPDGLHVIADAGDAVLQVWRADNATRVHALAPEGPPRTALAVGEDPSGTQYLVSAAGVGLIHVRRLPDMQLFATLRGHEESVTGLAVSAPSRDGSQYIVSTGHDGTVRVWRAPWGGPSSRTSRWPTKLRRGW